jgi:hypothetical protein
MTFTQNDITTDSWFQWNNTKRRAGNDLLEACCQSQLMLIRLNFESLQEKLLACEWSTDAQKEFGNGDFWTKRFYRI